MSLTKTPICNFGEKIKDFSLVSTDNKKLNLSDLKGSKGTLIMFICNHCPYVQAIIKEAVKIANEIKKIDIHTVAIMSNDVENYPEDSFENMKLFSKKYNFTFPYLIDETQDVAKSFGAVCTPDFFGYNKNGELQYRGRIRKLNNLTPVMDGESELLSAMKLIADQGQGPKEQVSSMGCNIKWK